jgi:GNAT superfamily N-acetyltransferase
MRIETLQAPHLPEAATLFVARLEAFRDRIPVLSAELADPDAVVSRLTGMRGVVAIEGDRLVGYLASWFPIAGVRGSARVGAYAPEWAHATTAVGGPAIDRELYRAVSADWTAAGCTVHAITLLADDPAVETWFWNGFGLTVVDAVRSTAPLGLSPPAGVRIRPATAADAPTLAELDIDHRRHYTRPPVLMPLRPADDDAAWTAFLGVPGNGAWLAEDETGPLGFIRFDRTFGGSDVVEAADGVFISGAWLRPSHRGRGVATGILDAALRHYASEGISVCAVDFEAFNPEATKFWLRHFTPVCYSLTRVPEALPG